MTVSQKGKGYSITPIIKCLTTPILKAWLNKSRSNTWNRRFSKIEWLTDASQPSGASTTSSPLTMRRTWPLPNGSRGACCWKRSLEFLEWSEAWLGIWKACESLKGTKDGFTIFLKKPITSDSIWSFSWTWRNQDILKGYSFWLSKEAFSTFFSSAISLTLSLVTDL